MREETGSGSGKIYFYKENEITEKTQDFDDNVENVDGEIQGGGKRNE